jgi:hypothetical protein
LKLKKNKRKQRNVKEGQSGYGYELTMKVKKRPDSKTSNTTIVYPSWPIEVMQALAKYTFANGGLLDYGDHVPNVLLHAAPTTADHGSGKIKHLLLCRDTHFSPSSSSKGHPSSASGSTANDYFNTSHGRVKFIQVRSNKLRYIL